MGYVREALTLVVDSLVELDVGIKPLKDANQTFVLNNMQLGHTLHTELVPQRINSLGQPYSRAGRARNPSPRFPACVPLSMDRITPQSPV